MSIRNIFRNRYGNTDTWELTNAGKLALRSTGFQVEDATDPTKVVAFDVSGVNAATTRTLAVPDYNVNLGSGAGRLEPWVSTGGAFATPIVLTAADSGKGYLLDDAAGLDFTLPAITAATVGMKFKFRLITEVTSNSYRITAGAADLLVGHVVIIDKDQAEGSTEALQQVFRPDGSDDLVITIAGADDTTGCLPGGWLELEAVSATRWFVRGALIGDGALATIFS